MSQYATIISTNSGAQVAGGTRVATVLVVGFTTKPHGIYAEVRLPVTSGAPGNTGAIDPTQVIPVVDAIAQSVEIIAHRDDVAALVYVQNVNAAGFLLDDVEITVQGSNPDFTDTFTWPLGELNEFVVGPAIQARVTALDSLQEA